MPNCEILRHRHHNKDLTLRLRHRRHQRPTTTTTTQKTMTTSTTSNHNSNPETIIKEDNDDNNNDNSIDSSKINNNKPLSILVRYDKLCHCRSKRITPVTSDPVEDQTHSEGFGTSREARPTHVEQHTFNQQKKTDH